MQESNGDEVTSEHTEDPGKPHQKKTMQESLLGKNLGAHSPGAACAVVR